MYNFKKIEKKWQKKWEESNIFKVVEDKKKKKFYCLEMFPYPSASGLHMGHAFNYTIGDAYSRFKRMNGFNVIYPMGYDSFGLPAENAAIKAKIHPKKFTEKSISNFIKQQKALGLSYDWSRMVSTCNPDYYKWNQLFFLKFMEKNLVNRKKAPVNWCPKCNTVLANEQVHDGKCWRHKNTEVEEKYLEQWFIKTTAYADELYDMIPDLEWPERIKIMQKNWINKSYGLTEIWDVEGTDKKIETFTTWPHTTLGCTFVVMAPEHPLIKEWVAGTKYEKEVLNFIKKIKSESMIDRLSEGNEKEGVFFGKYAINYATGRKMPIYVANFAIMEYGSGIVKCCPAHDQRDFEFAKKYDIEIIPVITPKKGKELKVEEMTECYHDEGIMINAKQFTGMDSLKAREEFSKWAIKERRARKDKQFKLRDWLISRQRYWGTPIPVIHCEKCGAVPVPEKDLPVRLPEKVKFGKGNPLVTNKSFVNTKCPKCKSKAKRETDTMDTFFDSSWYFLRYCDNKNPKEPFKKSKVAYWAPVDQYIGGAEHACMHLIYARFFTKALRDLGFLKFDEPFKRLFNQGMLHGEDGHVMSKSRGNVVLPEIVSEKYGIDTARFFLTSIASPDKDLEWSDKGIEGSLKFIKKVFNYVENVKTGKTSSKTESKLNKTIKGVTKDIEEFRYNLAIIKIRTLFDSFEKGVSKTTLESFLKLLHPFCPHITEELWEKIGNKDFLSLSKWPSYDKSKINEKAEASEEILFGTIKDIRNVLELTKLKKPEQITLFVSSSWKYGFFSKLKKEIEKTRDIGQLIKKTMIKEHGKEIAALVPKIFKDPSKIPLIILDQKTEINALKEGINAVKKEFNAKNIEILKAEGSSEQKAKQALPGKPAILIK